MIVDKLDKLMSLDARGSFGYSGGFGRITPGWASFGFYNELSGIYSRKKTLNGHGISRMRFYGPSNPRSIAQQAWRAKMAPGWTAYSALTTDEKVLLSKQARRVRMTGPNLFMRRWLYANR